MGDERYLKYKKILDASDEYQVYVRNNKVKAIFMMMCTLMMWALMLVMYIFYNTPLMSLSFLGIVLSGLTAISGLYLFSAFHDQPVFITVGTVMQIKEYKKKKSTKPASRHIYQVKDDAGSIWALDLRKVNTGKEQIYKEGDHVVLFSINENRSYIALSR